MDEVLGRLATFGAETLSDRELLAVVMQCSTDDPLALERAHALLDEFGSLRALSLVRPEQLSGHPCIGSMAGSALAAAFQLSRRITFAEPKQLRCAADVAAASRPLLEGIRQERVVVVVCDAGNRVLRTVKIAEGSVDRSPVPVREVLHAVLRHDGRAFALAHNHPGGAAVPSGSDRHATEAVKVAATVVGLRFLGHVVLTDDGWASVA